MSTTVEVAAIAAPSVLALAGLGVLAAAREWVGFTVSVSVRVIPGAKRRPRAAVEVVQVPAADTAPAAPVIPARRPA